MSEMANNDEIRVAPENLGAWQRSHRMGEVNAALVGETVTLMGWLHKTRDHGGVLFVDLRDYSGLVQVVFHPQVLDETLMNRAKAARGEFVLGVRGTVRRRPDDMINPDLSSGEIEVDRAGSARAQRIVDPAVPGG